MSDEETINAIRTLVLERWPGAMCGTEPGCDDPDIIIGAQAQAFITRGPFTNMGAPTGEPGSFYVHADAPTELAALLLAFARAVEANREPVAA